MGVEEMSEMKAAPTPISNRGLDAIAHAIKENENRASGLRESARKLESEARRLEEEAQGMRDKIKSRLSECNETRRELDSWIVELLPGNGKVKLHEDVDEKACTFQGAKINPDYIRTKEELRYDLIRSEIKAGRAVAFATVEPTTMLVISAIPAAEPTE